MVKVYAEILTPSPLTSREDGAAVLDLWEKYLPDHLPERIGNWEPIKQPFDRRNRAATLDVWRWPFLALRRKPRMDVQVFMRKGDHIRYATWVLGFDYGSVDIDQLGRFVRAAATTLEADLACLTLLTDDEIAAGRRNGTVLHLDKQGTRFTFMIASQHVQDSLPDVYWLTVLGRRYVQLFGAPALLSSPVHVAEQLTDNAVALQLTPRLDDTLASPREYSSAKRRLKDHLGMSAFALHG